MTMYYKKDRKKRVLKKNYSVIDEKMAGVVHMVKVT